MLIFVVRRGISMGRIITLDIETYFDKTYSLKRMTTLEYISDSRFKIHGIGFKIDDQPAQWSSNIVETIAYLSLFKNDTLLCHNTQFDATALQYHFDLTFKHYADTRAMCQGFNPHGSASLEELAKLLWPDDQSKRKGEELSTFEGICTLDDDQESILSNYCINDVNLTYEAFQSMAWYPQSEREVIDLTCRMFVIPNLYLDVEAVKEHQETLQTERLAAVEKTGLDQIQFSSNQKFAALLESKDIKVPTKISKTTGNPTFALAKNDLEFINLQANNPHLNDLWTARRLTKSTQEITRCNRFIEAANRDNGKMRIPLRYFAAHTGRWGGAEKINMQNLGRKSALRKALCAPKNHFVYVRDLSQIEARINACNAGQDNLIEQFRSGQDVYSIFASTIYNRTIDRNKTILDENNQEIKPDATEGFVGKVCVLALGYGMGADTFRLTLAVGAMGGEPVYFSRSQCYDIVRKYRATNHAISAFWDICDRYIYDMQNPRTNYVDGCLHILHNRIVLPNGMALSYPHLEHRPTAKGPGINVYHNRHGWTNIYGGKLCENIVQALARIVITDYMTAIDKELNGYGHVVHNVHDEILVVAPDENPQSVDNVMADVMKIPPSWMPDLPVDSDGGYAINYSK